MPAPDIRLAKSQGDPALEMRVSSCLDLLIAVREFRGLGDPNALTELAMALKPVLQSILEVLEAERKTRVVTRYQNNLMIETGILLAACNARDAGAAHLSQKGFENVKFNQFDQHLEGPEIDLNKISIRISTLGAEFMRLAIPDFITAAEDYLGSNAPASENGRASKKAS